MTFLHNEHIRLRALEPSDVPFLYTMENDSSAWNAGSNVQPYSLASLRDYVETQQADIYADKQLRLVITPVGSDAPIGLVDLYDFSPRHRHAWVAIMVKESYRKKGIAKVALQLLAEYAFQFLHLRLLMSMVAADNPASLQLFQSAGFSLCGQFPNYFLREEGCADAVCLQLEADTYIQK